MNSVRMIGITSLPKVSVGIKKREKKIYRYNLFLLFPTYLLLGGKHQGREFVACSTFIRATCVVFKLGVIHIESFRSYWGVYMRRMSIIINDDG